MLVDQWATLHWDDTSSPIKTFWYQPGGGLGPFLRLGANGGWLFDLEEAVAYQIVGTGAQPSPDERATFRFAYGDTGVFRGIWHLPVRLPRQATGLGAAAPDILLQSDTNTRFLGYIDVAAGRVRPAQTGSVQEPFEEIERHFREAWPDLDRPGADGPIE